MDNVAQRFTTVAQCEAYLFTLRGGGKREEPLAMMHTLLAALGHPEQRVPFIHVAGTNGKGSTVNFMRELLQEAGVRVGAFTSPHLQRMNERMTINGQMIDDAALITYVNTIMAIVEEQKLTPNFFEVMTAITWRYFADKQVDIALIEVGIGGRIDSTNVATPLVSVITSIGFDHIDLLGERIEQIAAEKAGVIKPHVPVVTAVTQREAQRVIQTIAHEQHASYYAFDEQFSFQADGMQSGQFITEAQRIPLVLTMLGAHQQRNAAVAIQAVLLLNDITLTHTQIQRALKRAMWAGRFEEVVSGVFVDGAHNEQGTEALIATLTAAFPQKRYHFIYAAMHDKDHAKSIARMDAIAATIAFTSMPLPRAATAQALADESTHTYKQVVANWQHYIEQYMKTRTEDDVFIVTGSLYFISEARPFIQKLGEQLHGNSRFSTL